MRQAYDNEIIRLSMHVRENRPIATYKCENKNVQIFQPKNLSIGMLNWADQILVATNAKRNQFNSLIRQSKGFGEEPEIGDKIIGLSNHWDFYSSDYEFPLTNGTIGTIIDYNIEELRLPRYIHNEPLQIMYTTMDFDGHIFRDIPIDYKCLKTGEPTLSPQDAYKLRKNKKLELEPPYDFAYGYAVTCHKFQGSQAEKVLVAEERFPFPREEHARWAYTAITRASDKLVLVQKN